MHCGKNIFQLLIQVFIETINGFKFLLFDHPAGIIAPLKIQPAGNKRPLVLLSGFWGRTFSWRRFAAHFHSRGYPVYPVDFGAQLGDINAMSAALGRFLEKYGLKDCILICHSLGGIVALNAFAGIEKRIYKIITMATPFRGTRMAYCFAFFKSAAQVLPGSALVKRINKEFQAYDKVINIRVRFDEIVLPLDNLRLHPQCDVFTDFGGHLSPFMSTAGIRFAGKILDYLECKNHA